MKPVDYVIPYVNCADPNWQDLYRKAVHAEFPAQRFRDNGTLRYQLRGIEANLPWVNRVFLIVQSESQIPEWLNVNSPKLRLVLHEDYIPEQYLPTFKSSNIELHVDLISDLSDNFILGNDDMIPIRYQPIDNYFVDDRPVQVKYYRESPILPSNTGTMQFKEYRMMVLERFHIGDPSFPGLRHFHLLIPYSKPFWSSVIQQYRYTFNASFTEKNGRGFLDINHWLISDLQVLTGVSVVNNDLNVNGYIGMHDDVTDDYIESVISRSNTICMNDNAEYNVDVLDKIPTILSRLLPSKSSFEL